MRHRTLKTQDIKSETFFGAFLRSAKCFMPSALYSRGFTLIELLVAAAIIALIASIVISNISIAQARSRDTKRVADLQQIQKALELYYTNTGNIPAAQYPENIASTCPAGNSSFAATLAPLIASKTIQSIAKDPSGKCWYYATSPGEAINCNGRSDLAYVLLFQSEQPLSLPKFIDTNNNATFYCLTNG